MSMAFKSFGMPPMMQNAISSAPPSNPLQNQPSIGPSDSPGDAPGSITAYNADSRVPLANRPNGHNTQGLHTNGSQADINKRRHGQHMNQGHRVYESYRPDYRKHDGYRVDRVPNNYRQEYDLESNAQDLDNDIPPPSSERPNLSLERNGGIGKQTAEARAKKKPRDWSNMPNSNLRDKLEKARMHDQAVLAAQKEAKDKKRSNDKQEKQETDEWRQAVIQRQNWGNRESSGHQAVVKNPTPNTIRSTNTATQVGRQNHPSQRLQISDAVSASPARRLHRRPTNSQQSTSVSTAADRRNDPATSTTGRRRNNAKGPIGASASIAPTPRLDSSVPNSSVQKNGKKRAAVDEPATPRLKRPRRESAKSPSSFDMILASVEGKAVAGSTGAPIDDGTISSGASSLNKPKKRGVEEMDDELPGTPPKKSRVDGGDHVVRKPVPTSNSKRSKVTKRGKSPVAKIIKEPAVTESSVINRPASPPSPSATASAPLAPPPSPPASGNDLKRKRSDSGSGPADKILRSDTGQIRMKSSSNNGDVEKDKSADLQVAKVDITARKPSRKIKEAKSVKDRVNNRGSDAKAQAQADDRLAGSDSTPPVIKDDVGASSQTQNDGLSSAPKKNSETKRSDKLSSKNSRKPSASSSESSKPSKSSRSSRSSRPSRSSKSSSKSGSEPSTRTKKEGNSIKPEEILDLVDDLHPLRERSDDEDDDPYGHAHNRRALDALMGGILEDED